MYNVVENIEPLGRGSLLPQKGISIWGLCGIITLKTDQLNNVK